MLVREPLRNAIEFTHMRWQRIVANIRAKGRYDVYVLCTSQCSCIAVA